jgi:hypothetical protein
MTKKTKLPFSMMPASWGLKGKSRAIAEAEYYYEGEELEKVLAGLDTDNDADKSVAEIEIDVKNGKLSQSEADKKIAILKEEPWVTVNKMGVDPENAKAGFIELDWNDHFVGMLQDNGYAGQNDEEIVNTWFNDVCRTVLIQEKADLDYGLQEGREDVVRQAVIDRDEDED